MQIIPYLTFRQTSEPLTQVILSLETLSLRRKAITTLIHLASHIPLALLVSCIFNNEKSNT